MRLLNLLLLVIALAAGGVYAMMSEGTPPTPPPAEAASHYPAAPDFSFNGTTLASLKGQIVLLNFWASWCAPCVEEFPQFIALTRKYKNVVLLAVSVDEDKAAMQRFLDKLAIGDNRQVIIVEDPDRRIAQDMFQTIRYPETFLIGPDLTLRRKYVGLELDWTGPEFAQTLQALGAIER